MIIEKIKHFPPFYTKQPHRETKEKQIELWQQVILEHCRKNNTFLMKPDTSLPPFHNELINRTIHADLLEEVLSSMTKAKLLEKLSSNTFIVWWMTPKEWADALLKHMQNMHSPKVIMTAFELFYQEDDRNPFYKMPEQVYSRVLNVLCDAGKVTLVNANATVDPRELGIKF